LISPPLLFLRLSLCCAFFSALASYEANVLLDSPSICSAFSPKERTRISRLCRCVRPSPSSNVPSSVFVFPLFLISIPSGIRFRCAPKSFFPRLNGRSVTKKHNGATKCTLSPNHPLDSLFFSVCLSSLFLRRRPFFQGIKSVYSSRGRAVANRLLQAQQP